MAGPEPHAHAYEAALVAAPTSPSSPGGRHRPQRALGDKSFGSSLGWTAAGTLLPGLGLTRTRARVLGLILLVLFVLAVAFAAVGALLARDLALSFLVLPGVLTGAWVVTTVFGVLWAGSIAATHLMLRPSNPPLWQRLLGSLGAPPTASGARSARARSRGAWT